MGLRHHRLCVTNSRSVSGNMVRPPDAYSLGYFRAHHQKSISRLRLASGDGPPASSVQTKVDVLVVELAQEFMSDPHNGNVIGNSPASRPPEHRSLCAGRFSSCSVRSSAVFFVESHEAKAEMIEMHVDPVLLAAASSTRRPYGTTSADAVAGMTAIRYFFLCHRKSSNRP